MLDSPLARAQAEDVIDPLTLGRRIRQLRTDAGLTLAEVADAIGTATSHLSVLENVRLAVQSRAGRGKAVECGAAGRSKSADDDVEVNHGFVESMIPKSCRLFGQDHAWNQAPPQHRRP